jgi:hypothetical protein
MKKALALTAAAVMFLGACAGGSSEGPDPAEDPKGALISAMEATGQAEGLTLHLTVQSDPASLDAMAKGDGGGSGMSEEDAQKILDSSITVNTQGSGEDGSFEMAVNVAGEDDFEMKTIDKVVYIRADVKGLVETFGGDPAEIDAGVQALEGQGLTFAGAAADGEWLSIAGLQEAAQQITGQTAPAVPEQEQLIKDLTASFKENAEVTSEGDDDAGEHLLVSVPLRATYENFVEDFQQLGQQLPLGQLPPSSEVPDKDVVFDVWVEDNRVTQLEFDFLQIAELSGDVEEIPEGVEQFAFRAEIDEFGDDIEAPEDAVSVDPQQIFGLFGGMMGGMGAGAGAMPPAGDLGAGFNCNDLKGAPPEVLSQFAEECPELQP